MKQSYGFLPIDNAVRNNSVRKNDYSGFATYTGPSLSQTAYSGGSSLPSVSVAPSYEVQALHTSSSAQVGSYGGGRGGSASGSSYAATSSSDFSYSTATPLLSFSKRKRVAASGGGGGGGDLAYASPARRCAASSSNGGSITSLSVNLSAIGATRVKDLAQTTAKAYSTGLPDDPGDPIPDEEPEEEPIGAVPFAFILLLVTLYALRKYYRLIN